MRRSPYIPPVVAAAVGLLGALAPAPASGQPPTVITVGFRTASGGSGAPSLITYGSTATFSVTVSNVGLSRAYSVQLSGTAPATTTITAASTGCDVSDDKLSFSCNGIGDLPDGQLPDGGFLASSSYTATFTVSLPLPPRPYGTTCPGGALLGPATATASAANAPPVPPASVNTTRTRPLADLAVTLAGPDTANEGDTLTYQINVANNGPCSANRVRLTNSNVGGGFIFQSNSGACESGYPCTVSSSFAAGASVNLTSMYVVAKLPGDLISTGGPNQVDVASTATPNPDGGTDLVAATPDPDMSNNSALKLTLVSHGTGCSSAGAGSVGLLSVVLLVGLALKRRRRT